jgi:hypothetical protein
MIAINRTTVVWIESGENEDYKRRVVSRSTSPKGLNINNPE